MRLLSFAALTGLILFLTESCYYDNKEELYQNLDSSCDTENVTYSETIQPIIAANCAIPGCHQGPTPSGGRDFSTYQAVKASVDASGNGSLIGRIKATTGSIMPASGSLPLCEIEKIQKWATDGAPNN